MTETEFYEALCVEMLDNKLSLVKALEATDTVRSQFYKRLGTDPAFAKAINGIREAQAEMLADELFDIADEVTDDWKRRRERIAARQWYLCRIVPRFRDKQEVEHSGSLKTDVLTDDERAARVTSLLDAARARRDGPSADG
jgi:hypothetical protein